VFEALLKYSKYNLDEEPPRQFKRRTSRLEMGIPIEEVFADIQFKTIEKVKSTDKNSDDENDVSTDPDELTNSLEADQHQKDSLDLDSDQERLESKFAALSSENSEFERKKDLEA